MCFIHGVMITHLGIIMGLMIPCIVRTKTWVHVIHIKHGNSIFAVVLKLPPRF